MYFIDQRLETQDIICVIVEYGYNMNILFPQYMNHYSPVLILLGPARLV